MSVKGVLIAGLQLTLVHVLYAASDHTVARHAALCHCIDMLVAVACGTKGTLGSSRLSRSAYLVA